MQKMHWDPKLGHMAQGLTNKCNINHSAEFQRLYEGSPCGENILTSPVPISWKAAVKRWEKEKNFLDFGVGAIDGEVVAHYTQLAAGNTYTVGCSVSLCPVDNTEVVFYVCLYYTIGNKASALYTPYIPGEPCSSCETACDGYNLCTNYCEHYDFFENCKEAEVYDLCYIKEITYFCPETCLCKVHAPYIDPGDFDPSYA
ncbi:cysteine-rich venom protein ophanin-like [Engystomops pustulosus]|uniref:cysteine-rich venom protein ophanin-like n=1 Tax=Engystomops pustulosus TaxID=76066 RepID=UPI003AFA3F24